MPAPGGGPQPPGGEAKMSRCLRRELTVTCSMNRLRRHRALYENRIQTPNTPPPWQLQRHPTTHDALPRVRQTRQEWRMDCPFARDKRHALLLKHAKSIQSLTNNIRCVICQHNNTVVDYTLRWSIYRGQIKRSSQCPRIANGRG